MVTKIKHRKHYKKEEYLPVKLIDRLKEDIFNRRDYEYRTKNNFLLCVAIIHYHQITKGIGINDYAPLGRNYWKKIFGGNYHESVIQPLLERNIIEYVDFGYRTIPDRTFKPVKGKQNGLVGIRYRINPELLGDLYETLSYIDKGKVLTATERMILGKEEFIATGISDMNYHVSIDPVKACTWIENNAESICNDFLRKDYVQSLPDKLLIEYREYLDKGSYNTKYLTVKAAREVAEGKHKELFFFKDTFYIADIKEFLNRRVPALVYHYKNQISLIYSQPIEEKRNPITLRLYSNLVNFPSRILQYININNRTVVQLDLRTSQFLIFANLLNVYVRDGQEHLLSLFKQEVNTKYLKRLIKILNQHEKLLPYAAVDIHNNHSGKHDDIADVTKFIRDVFFHDFYAVVQQELALKDRMLAKRVLFKLLFKKTNRPDTLLIKLSQRYPIVMNIIAAFKRQDGKQGESPDNEDNYESNFSVFLQCIEGEIFVDNILQELRTNNIPCFTRHDSIVVAGGYEEKAEETARTIFSNFGFKYNHKVEDKFWDVVDNEELEDSGYFDSLSDEDELNTDFSLEESLEETIADEGMILAEEHIETMEKLSEIGIQEDYFEYVNVDLLAEISDLPFLTPVQRNWIEEDIMNVNYGMSFFQPETDKLLRWIVQYKY